MLAEILAGVVAEGTGKRAAVAGYQVAGKTGTARKPSETGGYLDKYVASFVGFAPVSEPRFVVAVILDEPTPYYGGLSAAPVFSQMMGFVLSYENVPPKGDQKAFAKGSPSNSLQDSVVAGDGGSKAGSAQKGVRAQGSGRT
jgi:cell division protein FtsI/penicillin-binding protein 2